MKIVVGSSNAPKCNAVRQAFSKVFPDQVIDVQGVKTNSGVSDHPTSAVESLRGAQNRIDDAQKQLPGADYYVGIESGLLPVADRAYEVGWTIIIDAKGMVATSASAGIEVKGAMLEGIKNGREMSLILEDTYGVVSPGTKNGFLGMATDDVVTRTQSYEEAVALALAQFKHPEYFR